MLGKRLEGSDFELVKYDNGNKLLAVVARLCLPHQRAFSTLGICKRLRIIKMSVVNKVNKGGGLYGRWASSVCGLWPTG